MYLEVTTTGDPFNAPSPWKRCVPLFWRFGIMWVHSLSLSSVSLADVGLKELFLWHPRTLRVCPVCSATSGHLARILLEEARGRLSAPALDLFGTASVSNVDDAAQREVTMIHPCRFLSHLTVWCAWMYFYPCDHLNLCCNLETFDVCWYFLPTDADAQT